MDGIFASTALAVSLRVGHRSTPEFRRNGPGHGNPDAQHPLTAHGSAEAADAGRFKAVISAAVHALALRLQHAIEEVMPQLIGYRACDASCGRESSCADIDLVALSHCGYRYRNVQIHGPLVVVPYVLVAMGVCSGQLFRQH